MSRRFSVLGALGFLGVVAAGSWGAWVRGGRLSGCPAMVRPEPLPSWSSDRTGLEAGTGVAEAEFDFTSTAAGGPPDVAWRSVTFVDPVPTGPVPPPAESLADRVARFEACYAGWSAAALAARERDLGGELDARSEAACAALRQAESYEIVPYELDADGRPLAYGDTRAGRGEARPLHDPRIVRVYDAPGREGWLRVELPPSRHAELYELRREHDWLELVVAGSKESSVETAMRRARAALLGTPDPPQEPR